jgi:2,4-dichlorophenol 6-monooxygenase
LESYSDERAPVGKQIVLRANQSRLDYAPVNACFRVEGAENPVVAGIALLKHPGAEGQARRNALLSAIRHKDTEFNASGIESNQRYESGAVLPDSNSKPEVFRRDPVLYLQPTTRPGAKLPHAWLVNERGTRISTLDAVGKGKFTVLTGIAGVDWVQAAEALDLPFLRNVMVGSPAYQDLYFDWREIMEIEEGGVILVRPDCYVAWRQVSTPANVKSAQSILHSVLSQVLSGPGWSHGGAPPVLPYQPNFGPRLFE